MSKAGNTVDVNNALILWFNEVRNNDVPLVGGKNASLGEMIHAGLRVPNGFAVTALAYQRFIEETKISKKIYSIIEEEVKDSANPKQYEAASIRIRELIEKTPVPKDIEIAIREAYTQLNKGLKLGDTFVAVRSSATAEDLPDASFAGQQETFLNVKGSDDLVDKVVKCWSSLFTGRAIFYRAEKKFAHDTVFISVGVQKMVNSRVAGVMFTINPVTGDESEIVVEGTFGLGEAVVSGAVTPDYFAIDKFTEVIKERRVAKKTVMYVRDRVSGETVHVVVPSEQQSVACVSDEELLALVKIACKIEKHYGKPMDIEWAIDQDLPSLGNIFLVQARPETVWSKTMMKPSVDTKENIESLNIVVKGISAGRRGYGFGVAKVAKSTDEAASIMQKGDILVTDMTNPDFVPYMKIASAIVTDKGGITSHAAIVSRELNIPCVVGTETGTQVIKSGQEYTVDSRNGIIYAGVLKQAQNAANNNAMLHITGDTIDAPAPVTATKIYMNLAIPEMIEEYKNLPFQGIGLMRAEFLFANYVKEHPLHLVEKGESQKLVDKFAEGVATVARTIQPRIVVVRFSDFKTNEYRDLVGGEKYEIVEENPMLGWRGCSRYISKWYEKAFRLECQAIKKCRSEWGLKNVYVMLPMVRTLWEAKHVLEIMRQEGLERSRDFKIWFMAETPSIAIMADEFSKLVDGFSIGSNDMTQGVLMIDRDSERLGQMGYFDERDPAVKRIIAHLITVAHENGCTVSICGEGPSNLPDFCDFLVRAGIDSISVNNDAVASTRRNVAAIEHKIILERLAETSAIAAGKPLKKPVPDWEW
ncbi:MAG: phosphoenolpyruvate synthase [Candidatus Bathyarchaeota archaeon]|uniref:phosphoenolpyruvate synthase n=1 Tax=Candidatus Bathycorpusculum sp. TaxID=2994959 RepID=UPI00282B8711|nr:phosphoenolpyruvate synthase [Candidatus Termiticorpusculum sp.]MCL2256690.1 phosphoenolpyruvate synthase [Candidatus Termiticorpusculum sp.]MCL2293122.1 phosphoenolpyruvate synthase [Candidatus Termiticorpusculum sp.]